MKKAIFILSGVFVMLAIVSKAQDIVTEPSSFQKGYLMGTIKGYSKIENTFNTSELNIHIKDYVNLKGGKMRLELNNYKDYVNFKNLDTIIKNFLNDVAFYKDSLTANPTGNVSIDYVIDSEKNYKQIRFKRHNQIGNIFMNQSGLISKLKYDNDTINIVIHKTVDVNHKLSYKIVYNVRVSFILGNYYDIAKLLSENNMNQIIDTLEKASTTRARQKARYSNTHPLTIIYSPNHPGKYHFKKYDVVYHDGQDINNLETALTHKTNLTLNFSLGEAIYKNYFTPMFDLSLGVAFRSPTHSSQSDYDYVLLSASPYYFFDKDFNNNTKMYDNWFLNILVGSIYESNKKTWLGRNASFGFGYLIKSSGNYIPNHTFKFFSELEITRRMALCPEIIFENNGTHIFPGLTLKFF